MDTRHGIPARNSRRESKGAQRGPSVGSLQTPAHMHCHDAKPSRVYNETYPDPHGPIGLSQYRFSTRDGNVQRDVANLKKSSATGQHGQGRSPGQVFYQTMCLSD